MGLGDSIGRIGGKSSLKSSKREEAKTLDVTWENTSGFVSESHDDSTISCFSFSCVCPENDLQLGGEGFADLGDIR